MAIAGALIGGGMDLIGGMMGNSASSKEARKNRGWQEYMSNTAHVRQVRDLLRAGLNPMLSVMGATHGASTPTGSAAAQHNPMPNAGRIAADAIPKAAMVANTEANTAKVVAETDKALADTKLSTAQAAETEARTPTHAAHTGLMNAQEKEIQFRLPNILEQFKLTRAETEKVYSEITQIAKTGRLTEAHIAEALSRTNLTNAQITEVQPRIQKMLAETSGIKAEQGWKEIKGLPGNLVKGILNNSAKSSQDDTVGERIVHGVRNSARSFRDDMRKRRSTFERTGRR